MNLINFDWFRPQNRHRHTPEKGLRFCLQSGLPVGHQKVEGSRITVRATLTSESQKT